MRNATHTEFSFKLGLRILCDRSVRTIVVLLFLSLLILRDNGYQILSVLDREVHL